MCESAYREPEVWYNLSGVQSFSFRTTQFGCISKSMLGKVYFCIYLFLILLSKVGGIFRPHTAGKKEKASTGRWRGNCTNHAWEEVCWSFTSEYKNADLLFVYNENTTVHLKVTTEGGGALSLLPASYWMIAISSIPLMPAWRFCCGKASHAAMS